MLNAISNNTIQLQKDITGLDVNGNELIVIKMYCNITEGKSINFIYDILNPTAYESNKDEIKNFTEEFKRYCESQSKQYGVELF